MPNNKREVRHYRWRDLIAGGLMVSAVALMGASPFTTAQGETLADALIAAYNANPELQAERARLRAVDEGVPIARAGWRPTVTVTGSWGYTERRASPSFALDPNQQLHPALGSVTATQTLFRGGRTLNSIRQAKAEVRAGRARLRGAEQRVLLDVVTAYLDVITDQSVVELNRNNFNVLKRQLEATRDRFKVGELTRTDVAQAEARLSRSSSSLTRSEADLIGSRSAYQRLVGTMPGTLAPPPPLPPVPGSEEEALQIGLLENPDLVQARETEVAARFAVAVAKGALLPTIQVQGELSHSEETSTQSSQAGEKSLVAQVVIPLYQGGAEWAQVRRARQSASQSLLEIANSERRVVEGVANTWEQLRAARAQIQSDQEQVRANEIAYDGVRQEAQVGSRTTLDVLDAEQELLDARVALVRSTRGEYIAAYNLLSATGRLSAQQLNLAVEVYDPTAYYRKVNRKLFGWDIKVRGAR